MADPLSLLTSISGLVVSAYRLAASVYTTIEGIKGAPKNILAVSVDIKALYAILGTLQSYLSEDDFSAGLLHRAISSDLGTALSNIVSVFKEIQTSVNGYKNAQESAPVSTWPSLKWHFRETQIRRWGEQLSSHKITLSVAIATANLINTNATAVVSRRIEEDIVELRTTLTELLIRLDNAEKRQETDVGLRDSDANLTIAGTSYFRSSSPSPVVSSGVAPNEIWKRSGKASYGSKSTSSGESNYFTAVHSMVSTCRENLNLDDQIKHAIYKHTRISKELHILHFGGKILMFAEHLRLHDNCSLLSNLISGISPRTSPRTINIATATSRLLRRASRDL
ncbi:hypothetical protein EV127DRAFT_515126 [Xylaria flabelliformis]|nr:hypothetical protein EV127DRAFT_515126 [Xylaria flabelliformis]